jgi:hypothetical protein
MGTLIPIWPTFTFASNLRAVAPLWVKIAVPLPYRFALMISTASSSVSAVMTVRTGPKISSLRRRCHYWTSNKRDAQRTCSTAYQ